MTSNDNDPAFSQPAPAPAEPRGQAALILVESLIHGLIERSVLTTSDSLDIVGSAIDVQADYATEMAGEPEMWRSHAFLQSIALSLRSDSPIAEPDGGQINSAPPGD